MTNVCMYSMDQIRTVCKLRTYPLGFGLQYLSCFSSLKTEGNKLRKQYKAGYNMCIHPLKSQHPPNHSVSLGPFVAAPASD